MTHYVIDVHHRHRTDPHTGQARIVGTRRTLVASEPGGPCTRPVTLHHAGLPVTVSCARALPAAQQCPACRVTITVRHTIHTDVDASPALARGGGG